MPRRLTHGLPSGQEERAAGDDLVAQERGPANAPTMPVLAPAYVRATHPEHGESVVFTPGEALPSWAAAALPSNAEPDELGVIALEPAP